MHGRTDGQLPGPGARPDGMNRRAFLGRSAVAGASVAGLGGLLQGCGGSSTGDAPIKVSKKPPSYYPSDYQDIVDTSKKEDGELVIYSNLAVYNWQPIIEGFTQRYPWVKSVSTNNLDSGEVFQRYYNEQAAGTPAADMLVSASPTDWITFAEKRGYALEYESPEIPKLPDFSTPLPGLYTFSTDPILMAYNKALLGKDKVPTGIGHLAELVKKFPKDFTDKVTTYDATGAFGLAINMAYIEQTDDAWQKLETILPYVRAEASSGPMVEKINSGEYLTGYFMSSTVVLPAVEDAGQILGWSYIDDGTPIYLRGMAISKDAKRPATAKLMLDFLLSEDGQTLVYDGGLTPYRNGLDKGRVSRSYQTISDEVGEDNLVLIGYDPVSEAAIEQFTARWSKALES